MLIFFCFYVKMTLWQIGAIQSFWSVNLSKSFEAVAGGWRVFLDFSPFLYCSHFFPSQALSARRHPRLCPKPTLRPYSCFCLLAAASLQPFQGSCRLCSLSGRGSEPCWDQWQAAASWVESPPTPACRVPQHCCGSPAGHQSGREAASLPSLSSVSLF